MWLQIDKKKEKKTTIIFYVMICFQWNSLWNHTRLKKCMLLRNGYGLNELGRKKWPIREQEAVWREKKIR